MRALLGFAKWLTAVREAEDVASALVRSLFRTCGGCQVTLYLRDPDHPARVWKAVADSADAAQVSSQSIDELAASVLGLLDAPVGADPGGSWMALERPERRVGVCRLLAPGKVGQDIFSFYNELVTFWFESRMAVADAGACSGATSRLMSSVLMFVLAADGRLLFVSDALASSTGQKAAALAGRRLEEWIGREWHQFHYSLERLMAGLPMDSFEAPLPGIGGVSQNLVFLARRSHAGAVCAVAFPVRQLAAMGRVAMQTARLSTMAQIASGLLAELDDPVTSIKVHAETLKEKLEERWGRKGMLEQVEDILAGVGRLSKLAGDLVSYAHSFEEEPSEISINALCEEALAFCHSLVVKKRARVRTALAGVVPPLVGSAGQIRQALVNVLTNALQALDEQGGSIVVRSWDNRDGTVGVSIADSGAGMDERTLENLFEPFFTTRQASGLGMSLVRDVVSMHGGTVVVDSEPGEGTVVTITLPVGAGGFDAPSFDEALFEDSVGEEDLSGDMDLIVEPKEDKKPIS